MKEIKDMQYIWVYIKYLKQLLMNFYSKESVKVGLNKIWRENQLQHCKQNKTVNNRPSSEKNLMGGTDSALAALLHRDLSVRQNRTTFLCILKKVSQQPLKLERLDEKEKWVSCGKMATGKNS